VSRLFKIKIENQNLEELINYVLRENPMHKKFINSSLSYISTQETKDLCSYIDFCLSEGLSIEYIAESYLTIVEDTFREQIYFNKYGKYRNKSFSDVSDDVYFNKEYMDRYMYGLAISSFLWPNHVGLSRFFYRTLPKVKGGNYLEIGPGHGYFLMRAMQATSFNQFVGVDISEASIKQSEKIISIMSKSKLDRLKLIHDDFLESSSLAPDSFDCIVMGEVLEHVEVPEIFLSRIYELAKDDAHIYISTCINAPAIDHIYLWKNTDTLEYLIASNGFEILQAERLPYEGTTLSESIEKKLAINVAYILRKKNGS